MDPRKLILKTVRRRQTVTREQLTEEFGARAMDAARLDTALASLVRSGHVSELEPGVFAALRGPNQVVGRLSMTRSGYGFVESPGQPSVYVKVRDTAGALHGDTVAVRLHARRGGRAGLSGEVAYVVTRGLTQIVGRFERSGKGGIVEPADRRITTDVFITPGETMDARHGEMVVARITRYPDGRNAAQGAIAEVLGPADAPGVDVEVIIREHGLRTEFPPEAFAAAEAIPESLAEEERRSGSDVVWAGREDLRDLFTITIDPVDARDFDDAISVERAGKGWRLWVHIADVSHYVPWGSAIDEEARRRATSVYLVDRVLPMLPERLSNGVCSLGPELDRLTMTAEMELDRTGLLERYRLYPSVIRSDRRLDYDGVDRCLEGQAEWPDDETRETVTGLRDIAAALGKRRVARGGLDFETVEPKVWLDEDGHPTHVTVRQRTVATNMIEEAMIRANEVVAEHMVAAGSPMIFRIHEDPDPEALAQVAVVLKEFDYPIKDVTGASPATFQKIIKFAHGRPEKLLINSLLLRALKRARYVDYLAGHFGLASEAYTHFTSPIRRYPDLIVHRLLKARLAGRVGEEPTASMIPELEWLAEHSSVMEREADMAEEDTVKVKLCELMAGHVGEVFDGIIVGVTTFGMFVQLENTAEGLVHVEAMADDYYRFEAERFLLVGEAHGKKYRLGDRLKVRILDVVVSDLRIDMEIA
jgi:ribonuclease R